MWAYPTAFLYLLRCWNWAGMRRRSLYGCCRMPCGIYGGAALDEPVPQARAPASPALRPTCHLYPRALALQTAYGGGTLCAGCVAGVLLSKTRLCTLYSTSRTECDAPRVGLVGAGWRADWRARLPALSLTGACCCCLPARYLAGRGGGRTGGWAADTWLLTSG